MNDKIYICHKCHGNLSAPVEGLLDCHCMCGWIRNWQAPITPEQAKQAQDTNEYPKEGYASFKP